MTPGTGLGKNVMRGPRSAAFQAAYDIRIGLVRSRVQLSWAIG
jgi:hypothetical protein